MNTELAILGGVGALLLVLTLIQGTRNVLVLGLFTAAGNQHDIPAWTGWNDRLNRAIRNLIEAIAIFTPIVVAVTALDVTSDSTALGAKLFLIARILHAPLYVFGVPFLRTTAWAVGVAGIVMVAAPLLG